MFRKSFSLIIVVLGLGLVLSGCAKKTALREGSSVSKSEESAAEREKARLEAQKRAQEEKGREAARLREEEAKKELAKKEFEKSLVAKKTPGIEGEIFESSLLKDIHFDFDRYDIRPEDTKILDQEATLLLKNPNVKIEIEGNCDERGTAEYNLALGQRRANSAKEYLNSLGVPASRILTISYGKEKPLDPGHDEEAWAKNRRDHFIVLPK